MGGFGGSGSIVRGRVKTKLSIDEWATFFGLSPTHFNQVIIEDVPNPVCGTPWFEHAYQQFDRVSREDISLAIREAETLIENYLGYRLAPSWETDERHTFPRPYRPELINLNGADIRARFIGVRASWGQFIRGGVEARTLIEAGATVVFSDTDGDGYKETATVTATAVDPTVVQACEIEVYYPGKIGRAEWEIRPASVSLDPLTGIPTITFARHQIVLDSLQETYPMSAAVTPMGVDGFVDANFLATVDVYRHYNDPSTQCLIGWEPVVGCRGCQNDPVPCQACLYAARTARLYTKGDGRVPTVGIVPADWDPVLLQWTEQSLEWPFARSPDVARIWYQAGYQSGSVDCPQHDLDLDLKRTVAMLAASLLPRQVCDCGNIQQAVSELQQDLAYVGGAEQLSRYQISPQMLNNPFGTRVGAVQAWRRLTLLPEGAIGSAILT